MLDDTFKIRYKKVPIAISENNTFEFMEMHNHWEFEILCIIDGEALVCVGDKKYNAKKGDLVFINPMELHSVTAEALQLSLHRCICFDSKILLNTKLGEKLRDGFVCIKHHIKNDDYLYDLFERAFIAFQEEKTEYETEASLYINLIFLYLLKNNLTDKESVNYKNSNFCKKVLEYISKHYAEKISSKHVADALAFNQSYFCRNFKKNFGTNFAEYLNMYRVSISRGLLEDNSKSVTQVAYECGFGTSAHYTRCFKKYYGVLPSEYKK